MGALEFTDNIHLSLFTVHCDENVQIANSHYLIACNCNNSSVKLVVMKFD